MAEHTCMQRSVKRRNSELLIGIYTLIYSLHIKKKKKKYNADDSPFFRYTVYPQCVPAERKGYLCFMCICSCYSAKMLLCWARQQECAQRCKESKTPASTFYHLPGGLPLQHNTVIKNSYTWNDPAPHQLTDVSLYGRICSSNCSDKKFVFFSSSHPSLCAQEKGGRVISLLTSSPNNPLGH